MLVLLTRGLALCALLLGSTLATAYPERAIRLVVGFPPGGGADFVARQVAAQLSQALGQTVVVDNKPGANGVTAAAEVARAPADGHTLLLGVTASQAIAPVLQARVPYDSLRDFTPVTEVGYSPLVLVVQAQSPIKSVGDFVRHATDAANQATFASAGIGNITHLAAELFMQSTGARALTHVPYKGSAPALTDLMGGRVTAYFDTLPSALPHIQGGQLRALGVTSPGRATALPQVPTLRETGLKDYEATAWYGLLGPARMAPEVTQRLHDALRKAYAQPEVRQQMTSRGVDLVLDTPRQFIVRLEADLARWRRVVDKGQIKLD